eukprot:2801225-Rhodomonas_salina.2
MSPEALQVHHRLPTIDYRASSIDHPPASSIGAAQAVVYRFSCVGIRLRRASRSDLQPHTSGRQVCSSQYKSATNNAHRQTTHTNTAHQLRLHRHAGNLGGADRECVKDDRNDARRVHAERSYRGVGSVRDS